MFCFCTSFSCSSPLRFPGSFPYFSPNPAASTPWTNARINRSSIGLPCSRRLRIEKVRNSSSPSTSILIVVAFLSVSRVLHTELHSMQGSKSTSSFSNITPCQPSDVDMDELSREMENMIVEHQLRLEAPIRPVWDTAVQRGRETFVAMQQRAQRRPPPLRQNSRSPVKGGLPSPPGGSVSPEIPFKELMPNGHAPEALDSSEQSKMPSPLPSRPPSRTQSPSRPASSL